MNVETLLTSWGPTVVEARWVTERPADLAGNVPLVLVRRVGGPDTDPTISLATVDLEYYQRDRVSAGDGAEALRKALRYQLPGYTTTDGVVAKVSVLSGPAWRPYDDPNVTRYGLSCQLALHTA